MKARSKSGISTLVVMIVSVLAMFLMDVGEAEARRGGSFGGRRGGSFGSSRRSSPSFSSRSRSSSFPRSSSSRTTTQRRSSFGGTRLATPQQYTRSYGIPRRTESVRAPAIGGTGYSNYSVHHYGGMGDRFMTGYLMGSTSWMWSMPFHPAFYYSRPAYYTNPNGVTEVYPPTFQLGKLIMTLVVIGGIGYVIYRVMRRRSSAAPGPQSSFS
jgi:hypothetical protein